MATPAPQPEPFMPIVLYPSAKQLEKFRKLVFEEKGIELSDEDTIKAARIVLALYQAKLAARIAAKQPGEPIEDKDFEGIFQEPSEHAIKPPVRLRVPVESCRAKIAKRMANSKKGQAADVS